MSSPKTRTVLAAVLLLGAGTQALAQQDNGASRSIRVIEKVPEAPQALAPTGEQPDRSPGAAGPASPAPPPAAAKAPPALPASPAETAKLPDPSASPQVPAPATPAKPAAPVLASPSPAAPVPEAPKAPPQPSPVTLTFLGKDRFGVGDAISIQVRSQIAGYLVLVDVASDGRIQQIYPNVYSMAASGADAGSGNYIKAGELVTVPDPSSPLANFEYLAGPPFGEGRLFAILSDKPVQYIDLPDLPQQVRGEQVAGYVQQATRSLRITPAGDGPLLDPRWSFGVATYVVEERTTQAKP